jgi:predicted transcriptional regulator
MLRSMRSGAAKTHIMYSAYMSFAQLKEYLKVLEEKELVRYDESSRLYRITDRGLRFMSAYDEIRELFSDSNERPLEERSEMYPIVSSRLSDIYKP